MADGLVTVVGHVVKEDPALSFTSSGLALTKFSVRVPGSKAKDGKPATEAHFVDVVCWRELAENVAESVRQGDRVIVRGPEKERAWTGSDGKEHKSVELNAWNVGPDLSYATAVVQRTEKKEADAPVAQAPALADF